MPSSESRDAARRAAYAEHNADPEYQETIADAMPSSESPHGVEDGVHADFLDGTIEYPEELREHITHVLEEVATYANRGELVAAIDTAYAVVGEHENWLRREAAIARIEKLPASERSAMSNRGATIKDGKVRDAREQ